MICNVSTNSIFQPFLDNKINYKVMVVYSDEKPLKISNPVGSNAFVPATAGLLCASYVINDIIKEKK